MDPSAALQEQLECYRRMSGQKRLAIALELHELACEIARTGIRRQFPLADQAEVDRRLRERIALAVR